MEQIILIFHFVFCLALIGLVLLQKSKGKGMGSAFSGGASSTVFGSKGSGGFLLKLTIAIATLFFATSITVTYMAARRAKSQQQGPGFLTHLEKISQQQQKDNIIPQQSK